MSNELWHADILITDELVINCIENQFPSLKPLEKIECLGEGWDNKVYLINKNIIFRFPRRKIAVELIARENAVLTSLQPIIHINIPHPTFLGNASIDYPYPFHGYKMILGQSGFEAALTEDERIASIRPLAHFLKQLHSIDAAQALNLGAKAQVFDRTKKEVIISLQERVNKIVARNILHINRKEFQREFETALALKLPQENHCLVHGDLYSRHLMFNKGQLTGIIDWGDVGINNRSIDLSVIWSFYPKQSHSQFFEIYGLVDSPTWNYARFLGLYSSFTTALYASDTGDKLLLIESINAIQRINSALLLNE